MNCPRCPHGIMRHHHLDGCGSCDCSWALEEDTSAWFGRRWYIRLARWLSAFAEFERDFLD
jgi:hypothetical protein